jgi:hypothetical protein
MRSRKGMRFFPALSNCRLMSASNLVALQSVFSSQPLYPALSRSVSKNDDTITANNNQVAGVRKRLDDL